MWYQIGLAMVWFVARVVLEVPPDAPLFRGQWFSLDGIVSVIGFMGIIGLITGLAI